MAKNNSPWFSVILILVFILPLITFALTTYTIYLKNQMKNLELKIEELDNNQLNTLNEVESASQSAVLEDLVLPQIEIGNTMARASYTIQELDYQVLLENSVTMLKPYNEGAVKVFYNQLEVFEEALYALNNDIPYFVFQNGDKYYLYRSDYSLEGEAEEQYLFSIQIYLYTTPAPAMFPTMALRQGGIPAFVFNGKFQQSNEDYWAILVGLFDDYNEAQTYLKNMDEELVFELTGLSIADRFTKGIYFSGVETE
ncbi:hypothetical protein X925_03160 [Petrotoga sp. 9T1HF07.CasAA.8.2]|jgi:hypothetical protein|uniref:hypothetical protein n=1 Tax=Petrotoga sp. 9T1HF07.CasAA.8.2 TaxID=1434329 RepID=UPI000CA7624C|nr:hypothetical protein [Petrotoga sp. 9T1HF07.CasAA.8.2]PNR89357.1 hypothetical protein X925_03160 [Petrotoga sp. 9T1HF07.CasAA.8.2]